VQKKQIIICKPLRRSVQKFQNYSSDCHTRHGCSIFKTKRYSCHWRHISTKM